MQVLSSNADAYQHQKEATLVLLQTFSYFSFDPLGSVNIYEVFHFFIC